MSVCFENSKTNKSTEKTVQECKDVKTQLFQELIDDTDWAVNLPSGSGSSKSTANGAPKPKLKASAKAKNA